MTGETYPCLMPRSHVCLGCGTDISGVRAPPDPHYGLPIVTCPTCAMVCVRRHAGGRAWVRTLHRTLGVLFRAAVMGLVTIPLLVLAVVFALWFVQSLIETRQIQISTDGPAYDDLAFGAACPVFWMIAAALTGFFCPHWRVRGWLFGVAGALLLLALLVAILAAASTIARADGPWLQALDLRPRERLEISLLAGVTATGAILATPVYALASRQGARLARGTGLGSARLRKTRKRRRRLS